jgi:glutamyl-tRNA synthetase
LFTKEELVEKFNLSKVSISPARFDPRKIEHFQGVYVRKLPDEEFEKIFTEYLIKGNLFPHGISEEDRTKIKLLAKPEKDRIRAFSESAEKARSVFTASAIILDEEATKVFNHKPEITALMFDYLSELETQDFTDAALLEQKARDFAKDKNVKFSEFVHPVRAVLTGTTTGPKLFEIMKICGKPITVQRIKDAKRLLNAKETQPS